MATATGAQPVAEPQRISSAARLLTIFYSPGPTFEDIARAPHFVLCWIVQVIVGSGNAAYMLHRIGALAMARQAMMQGAAARTLDPATFEQRAQLTARVMHYSLYASPLSVPLVMLIFALIFLGVVNFLFGKEARFKQIVAVVSHAMLPLTLFALLSMAVLRFSDPANFLFTNAVGSNAAFYLDPATTSPALYALLAHLDLFAFWCVVLLALGMTKLGRGLRFASMFGVTASLWLLFVLGAAGVAAI